MRSRAGIVACGTPSTALLVQLRSAIGADRVLTGGAGYLESVTLYNAAVDIRPAVVVRCASTADVQAAVRIAREYDVPLSVRGGGHDFWGRGLRAGGMVLDLAGMRQVVVDASRRLAVAGGGALSSDVLKAAESVDLTAVTGASGAVGMAGLTLGGGYGGLTGHFGLAADNLLAAEVVLADGTVVNTDAQHEPDLWWALRGGGGNFGVVTSMRIRLHPAARVVAGTILYPLSAAGAVLRGIQEVLSDCPKELSVDTGFSCAPNGDPVAFALPTWSGDLDQGLAQTGPVHALARLGTPLLAQLSPTLRSAAAADSDAAFPAGRMTAIRTRSVSGWTPDVIDIAERAARTFTSPMSAILLHQFHGAATQVPVDSAAFGRRAPHLMADLIAQWERGDDEDRHVRWVEDLSTALAPHSLPGGYVNLLGPGDRDQIADSYGPNTERLLAIKSSVDPDGIFTATPLPV